MAGNLTTGGLGQPGGMLVALGLGRTVTVPAEPGTFTTLTGTATASGSRAAFLSCGYWRPDDGRIGRPATGTTARTIATTARPVLGSVVRPLSGTTARTTGTTARPTGTTTRPLVGTTSRPDEGDTTRPTGTTARPLVGTTARPGC